MPDDKVIVLPKRPGGVSTGLREKNGRLTPNGARAIRPRVPNPTGINRRTAAVSALIELSKKTSEERAEALVERIYTVQVKDEVVTGTLEEVTTQVVLRTGSASDIANWTKYMVDRARGTAVQKVETKNMSINVNVVPVEYEKPN